MLCLIALRTSQKRLVPSRSLDHQCEPAEPKLTQSCVLPLQIATNKRYSAAAGKGFTVSETAKNVEDTVGKIDVLVHSLANGPEVAKPLLETSRKVCFRSSEWLCGGDLIHTAPNQKHESTAIFCEYSSSLCGAINGVYCYSKLDRRQLYHMQWPLTKSLLQGYLAALSASSYSYVSMLQHFGSIMNAGGAAISLTYVASEKIIPGICP